jgi:hypothetical protein
MPFGIIDTTFVDLPVGLDEGYIRGLQTRSGLSVAEMIQRTDAAMTAVNAGADPLVADLSYRTASESAAGRVTASKRVMRAGEYVYSNPQYVARKAHMLPLEKYDIVLGFTEDGLQRISMPAFENELDAMVDAFGRLYTAEALARLFSTAEFAVDEGTTSVSPGFAGSGTGTNVFDGVFPNGETIGGGYTHYAFGTTDASIVTWLNTAIAQMERWVEPPYDLVASSTFIAALQAAAITAGTPIVLSGSALIRLPDTSSEALVDQGQYMGVYGGKVRIRHGVSGFGDLHAALFKTYGAYDSRNPLAWRYDPLYGPDAFVRSNAYFPLADAIAMQWLGFGVSNRTGASLFYRNAGAVAYVNPTITII